MINNEEAQQKVDDLFNQSIDLFGSWETEFISDMKDRTEFTDGQLFKIDELWRKYCE